MKLQDLAAQTFAAIEQGDGETEISGAAGLGAAGFLAVSGEVAFLANPKYTPQIQQTKAAESAIFLNEKSAVEIFDTFNSYSQYYQLK